ncbi:hypothetical protein SAMN05421548_14811 [Paraburkholderia lycopersici]|uniref:Major facilitator superfamily (MFS) profile domain-containing protein n=1 Tax=Paraburkholderia lycopersici TaxID=416944 RepID=A0A1G7CU55_9BURK|nr:hypothetical protein SAMN05421548_14811 [Paraburkholderia lycopersici]
MMPLGPQIMRAFAITPSALATAISAYSLCPGLSEPLAATYIDRIGRRLRQAAQALFALATNVHLLLAARAFAGLTGGMPGSIVMALVSDGIPAARRAPERRQRGAGARRHVHCVGLGGQWLTRGANGAIASFGENGWIAATLTCATVPRVKGTSHEHGAGAPATAKS